MVLFTGISKKQIASFGRVSPVSGIITSSYCHLTHPTRNRTISSDRKRRKTPDHSKGTNHLQWIDQGFACCGSKVFPLQIYGSPQKFRPAISLDNFGIWANQIAQGARRPQNTQRIEANGNPLPLLAITKEDPQTLEQGGP